MFDYHIHSDISFDAHSPAREIVACAGAKGAQRDLLHGAYGY